MAKLHAGGPAAQPTMQSILLQLTGVDRPGIIASVLSMLADSGAAVQDVEQIVMRGRISLSVVVDIPDHKDLLKEVLLFGRENDLEVDFDIVGPQHEPRPPGWVVTLVGVSVGAEELHRATRAISDAGANIDRMLRLSRYPVISYELIVSGPDGVLLKSGLLRAAATMDNIDIAVQREGLGRQSQRIVLLDVDSTLIQNEVIDLLADQAGVGPEVASITEAAMRGELDFEESVRQRVRLLAGQPEEIVERAWANLVLTPGARTFVRTLKSLGYRIGIVSGGFTAFTDRLRDELDLDWAFSNHLEVRRGILTGELTGRVIDREAKGDVLRSIAAAEGVTPQQIVAIGDGANDLEMLAAAGLGIAFNAKPVVKEAADAALNVPYLDAALFLLGVRSDLVDEAAETAHKPIEAAAKAD